MASRQGMMMATRSEFVDAVHEDFTEWTEDAAANVLTVRLPGFKKEQIKVTYDQNPPKMTIRGERPVGSNVMIQFSKDFPIPDNCKINGMKAKFDRRQVLTITMPKNTIIAKEVGDLAAAAKREVPVNPGMAVIVIVAVGAYAGYKLGSSSHSRS
ncbi:inactive protein RESTRICTED TEV MOVEMENT 2-like [Punica granatum]|uniref:Inactive protein RESTRICTED TEV MOVEMENT 2-like n=1 Tax=Punica granatum TaxID=22663 RepID=A0A6P8C5C0_PUNGR|nr:inactive protein RESTRICTED TEV MOVEMENT 2-like [Punica granatum]